jgi:hypothetical protein
MPKRVLAICAVLAFAAVVLLAWRGLSVQLGSGSVYPAFSSLRADAEGAKALHDVAETLGRQVSRSYQPLAEAKLEDATMILLGLSPGALVGMAQPSTTDAASMAKAGNVVVLGAAGRCDFARIDQWQLKLECLEGRQFFDASNDWKVLQRTAGGHAQIVERSFGSGSVVLVSDSRLLSNGALALRHGAPAVAAILDKRAAIVFDEEHLGVEDNGSVGVLIRRYRLHGVVAAILAVFAAFVWMSTSSFLPCVELEPTELTGREAGAGLANLLRRTIPSAEIATASIEEWTRSAKDPTRAQRLREAAAQHRTPVAAYNDAARALRSKHDE